MKAAIDFGQNPDIRPDIRFINFLNISRMKINGTSLESSSNEELNHVPFLYFGNDPDIRPDIRFMNYLRVAVVSSCARRSILFNVVIYFKNIFN